jgi:ABC-2 type transport system ATP-binding protein
LPGGRRADDDYRDAIDDPRVASSSVIVCRGLTKSYSGSVAVAVDGIDLRVERGEVFALLGPNGAGKTTTVEILEGHRARTSGDVSVLGFDPGLGTAAYKQRIGVVLQETSVERFLTVSEVIDRFRGFFPNPRPRDEVIEVVGLRDQRDQRVRRLSGGQQRRLDVAIGLAGDPELLFLDEPTTGFDPAARRGAWEMVRNLQTLGKTVFLTTHYMDEAQYLANRVAVIVGGRIVAEGPPDTLASADGAATKVTFRRPPEPLPVELSDLFVADGAIMRGTTESPIAMLHRLTEWALAHDVELDALEVTKPSLEDAYLALVGYEEQPPSPDATGRGGRRSRRRERDAS